MTQHVAADRQQMGRADLLVCGQLQGFADQTLFEAVRGLAGLCEQHLFKPFVQRVTWRRFLISDDGPSGES